MKLKTSLQIIESYIDYFFPREIIGPVILVFSLENVVDRLFQIYFPLQSELLGWSIVLIISLIIIGVWGEVDEDKEELEEEIEEIIDEENKEN